VAVVEAGPSDDDALIRTPLALGQLWHSRFDWDLLSEPEPGLSGRRGFLPRGRVLGGSSSLNAMIYIRGNRADYDEWARLGLAGWSFDEVLPYFRRAEDNERGESRYHGVGGPLAVSDGRSKHPLVGACLEAAVQAGLDETNDHNGAAQEGAGWFQLTQRDGRRCSTADAYLRPALERGNVDVLTEALATRILFDSARAVGVELLRGNALETLRAEREVIVCAGAYHSPQLLLLSGIGPADELRSLEIEPRVDLPVGRNLHDHAYASVAWRTDEEDLSAAMTTGNVELFEREGMGPLTSSVSEGCAFLRTQAGLEAPDIQLHFFPLILARDLLDPPASEYGYSIGPTLLKPTSRGAVTLRSAVPHVKPRIVHNYLTTEEDRRSMIEGTRAALELGSRPALERLCTGDVSVPRSDADRDILDFLERCTHTVFHPVGTCAMGAVVDAELRVLGVEGLRVADASVMPAIPRGNTNAPSIMVGEKAADLIRGLRPLPVS
jgi:choline dehydrogenase-like flavoprotein